MEISSDLINSNLYSLSIRFSSDGFSLYIRDENNLLISSKKVPASLFTLSNEEITLLLSKENETKLAFKSIRLIIETDNYTFVPIPIFKPADMTDLLYFEKKQDSTEQVLYNSIIRWNVVNVFSLPKGLYKAILNTFPEQDIQHHMSHLLSVQIKSGSEDCIHIFVRAKTMDCVVISDGGLMLVNSFTYNTTEDFIYFTLNLFEQLKLDIEQCRVYLHNCEKSSGYQANLLKFIKYCETPGNPFNRTA